MKTWISTLGIAAGCALACVPQNAEQDSRTTWLSSCDEDADCDSDLACVCGRCTLKCEESTCDLGPSAVCRQSASFVSDCSGSRICTQTCESSEQCPFDLECRSGSCVQAEDTAVEPRDAEVPQEASVAVTPTDVGFDDEGQPDSSTPPLSVDASTATSNDPNTRTDEGDPSDQTNPSGGPAEDLTDEPTTDETTTGEIQLDAGVDAGEVMHDTGLIGDCSFGPFNLVEVLDSDSCGEDICPTNLGLCDELNADAVVDRYFHSIIALEHRAKSLLEASQYWVVQSVAAWTGEESSPDDARDQIETLISDGMPGMVIGPIEHVYELPECGTLASDFVALAAECDSAFDPGQLSATCEGRCLSPATNMASCSGDAELSCYESRPQCEGTCVGDCELLAGAKCEGICLGVCETQSQADCAGEFTADTQSPSGGGICEVAPGMKCNGACTGACEIVGGQCDGTCRGKCEYTPPEGGCAETARCDGEGQCAGSCNGELSSSDLIPECEASTATLAVARARCNPTLAQTTPTQLAFDYDPQAVATALECYNIAYSFGRDVQTLAIRTLEAAEALNTSLAMIEARLEASEGAKAACALGLLPDAQERIDVAIARLQSAIGYYY